MSGYNLKNLEVNHYTNYRLHNVWTFGSICLPPNGYSTKTIHKRKMSKSITICWKNERLVVAWLEWNVWRQMHGW